ncbi:helix-turn-helix domain-containing protein [Glutamicibacter sp. NPDC087344]|uniref:helix-turn-helix domain-containing protein n=1 Tax=Glutamicibacter sp. NPDC087344 TaxID=3363994 RepID=UPI0037FDB6DA
MRLHPTVEERNLPSYAAGSIEVPFVIGFYQEKIERDTYWPAHSHPTHELLWNSRGASSVTVGARTWTVSPVLGMWIPAGVLHSGGASAGTSCNMNHFGFSAVDSISAEPVPVEMTPLLRLLLEKLARPDLSERSRQITEAAALDNLQSAPMDVSVCVPRAELLQPIVRHMLGNPGPADKLQDWAQRLGVNSRTLTRAFQQETGGGYTRWVASLQAQHAIDLVGRGEDLHQIADQLGYNSISALGAAFRRTTGFTLSRFRSQ